MEVAEKIFQGSKIETHLLLYFILQDLERLKERVYLGFFLVDPQIPDEYLLEPQIQQLLSQYNELKEAFKTDHQELEELNKQCPDLEGIQSDIRKFEKEKELLKQRLSTYQNQQTKTKEFQILLEATNKLRIAQEDENNLYETLLQQQDKYDESERDIVMLQ